MVPEEKQDIQKQIWRPLPPQFLKFLPMNVNSSKSQYWYLTDQSISNTPKLGFENVSTISIFPNLIVT